MSETKDRDYRNLSNSVPKDRDYRDIDYRDPGGENKHRSHHDKDYRQSNVLTDKNSANFNITDSTGSNSRNSTPRDKQLELTYSNDHSKSDSPSNSLSGESSNSNHHHQLIKTGK